MKPKPTIISIKCPHCQERYMIPKYKMTQERSIFSEKEWICINCPVWVWPESWFNEFTQFEHLIEREER